ncbi:MAG: OmpP1/FadL family transporter [Gammaproteobacteria bacterium]|nr:OmpP1/FadL family transporter [Gammaproteobacteria bacterium]
MTHCIRSLPKISVLTFLLSQIIFTPAAHAAGFQLNEISPSLQGAATAGAAVAENDVSSMFSNPATLSSLIENQAYLGGSEIMPHIKVYNASAIHTVNVPGAPDSSITAPVQGSSYQNSISPSAFAPNAYLSWRFNQKLVAGLGIVAPFGLTTGYNSNSVLRFAADESSVRTININPAISYEVNDKFSVGVGLQAQYIKASFSNYNGPYTGTGLDTFFASNLPTRLNGSSWGFGYTIGAVYKPNEYTHFGLGFRSQVSEALDGSGRQYTSPGPVVPAPSQDFLFNAQTSIDASIKTPAVLTLSAARDIGKLTLKASAQVNFWYTFNQLSIYMPQGFATNSTLQTDWKNSWLGALGADYRVTPAWTVRGGVAYDQTPTRDTYRDPRIPDTDRVWLALGTSYKATKHLSFDGAYTHLFMSNQTVNVTQSTGTNAVSTLPLEVNQVHANYKGSADIVALAVRYSY